MRCAKFDNSSWTTAQSAFSGAVGVGKSGTPWTSGDIWLRQKFTVADTPKMSQIRTLHHEDIEVYLNGVLAIKKSAATLKPGENPIAVHVRQTSGGQNVAIGMVDASQPQRGFTERTGDLF